MDSDYALQLLAAPGGALLHPFHVCVQHPHDVNQRQLALSALLSGMHLRAVTRVQCESYTRDFLLSRLCKIPALIKIYLHAFAAHAQYLYNIVSNNLDLTGNSLL